jgi:hypothetical protein
VCEYTSAALMAVISLGVWLGSSRPPILTMARTRSDIFSSFVRRE